MTEQELTEQELKEKIAFLFKIAREEGAIVKWADGQLDAEEVLALIKEAGYVRLSEDQTLPLTKMELFLKDNHSLEIKENGERIRHINAFYPEPNLQYPATRLSIKGEYIAEHLRSELEAQQGMLGVQPDGTAFRRVRLAVIK